MSKVSVKDDPNSTKFEQLSEFITAVANNDEESATKTIQEYVNIKAKEIIQSIREDAKGKHFAKHDEKDEDEDEDDKDVPVKLKTRATKKQPLKKMKKDVDESLIVEEDESIKLKGDDVFFEGKLVGTYENDLDTADKGIVFKSSEGKSKEFNNIKEFYAHLMQEYGKDTGLDKKIK